MTEAIHREFVGITDQTLEALRQRIGQRIEHTLEPWCYEATRDNIRHYAHGIGDDNPLWCDPAYGKTTRYGDIIALPSFLFACSRIVSGYVGGLPGVHAMFAGCDFTWMKPIRRNAQISTQAHLKDLIEHDTKFAGRSVQQIYHVDFFNQHGDKVADADSWCFRTERDHARERGRKYESVKARPPRRYTDEELAPLYRLYAGEEVRGAAPRYWQDVTVGEALPRMAKGPMTVTGLRSTRNVGSSSTARARAVDSFSSSCWLLGNTASDIVGLPFNSPNCFPQSIRNGSEIPVGDHPVSYSQMASIGLQHQFTGNMAVDSNVVWTGGRAEERRQNLNSSINPNTLYALRRPVVLTTGCWPTRAQVYPSEPHCAQLALSPNSSIPPAARCRR